MREVHLAGALEHTTMPAGTAAASMAGACDLQIAVDARLHVKFKPPDMCAPENASGSPIQ